MSSNSSSIQIKRKPSHGNGLDGNTNAVKSGMFSNLTNLDGRSVLAKALSHIQSELVSALGGPETVTPQERILIDRVSYKMARCVLFEADSLSKGGTTSSDAYYLTWSNSIRQDLLALGLRRRPKAVQDLRSYLEEVSQND
jgi:hypothetical protein